MEEPHPTVSRVLLADGSPALVGRLGPKEAPDVLELHRRLREQDVYLRFATIHPADLEGYLSRTLSGQKGAVSLGAWVRGCLVGVVDLHPVGRDVAEVAAVVDPVWQGHGVATTLLEELAAVALRLGIRRLTAQVLAENGRMMRVLTDLGLPLAIAREGNALSIEVALHGDERYGAAAEERSRRAAAAGLSPVLRPDSVVVIGAGRSPGSVGRAVLRSLQRSGFTGALLAVHPPGDHLDGVTCVPRIADLPEGIDLAVVAVPARALDTVVADCGRRGVRAVVVLTSGVAEVPGLAGRLRELADRYAMRLVGPNTVGVVGPGTSGRLDTSFIEVTPPPGDVGLVTQSGGVAIAAGSGWERLGLGVSAMVAVGDALDVGARDVLAWFDEDPATQLAVLYAESEPDLRALARTAAHLAERMPILALEPGTSQAGQRAAASHTARSATPSAVRNAAYDAAGIQRVEGLTDLAAAVALLRGQPLPTGPMVAVLTNAGGAGVLTADALAAVGIDVEPLSPVLQEELHAVLPALATTGNPIDASAAASADDIAAALQVLLAAAEVGAVVVATVPTALGDPGLGVAAAAAAAATRGAETPVVAVRPTQVAAVERVGLPVPEGARFLLSVADPITAARALTVAMRRRDWLSRPPGTVTVPGEVDVRAAREVVDDVLSRAPAGDWLLPPETIRLCAAAGLATVPTSWAPTARDAVAAAAALAGPLVVKGHVRGVVHKGDAGLLRMPVTDPAEAGRIVAEWAGRAGESWLGAVLQPLVPAADEFLVGAVRDPAAGPVVALGPGGRATDALGHRVHRLAPLTDADVAEMLSGTGLLDTTHGRSLHRRGIEHCLRAVSWLADSLPELAEFEVNPLVVTENRALALDVRVRVLPVPSEVAR